MQGHIAFPERIFSTVPVACRNDVSLLDQADFVKYAVREQQAVVFS